MKYPIQFLLFTTLFICNLIVTDSVWAEAEPTQTADQVADQVPVKPPLDDKIVYIGVLKTDNKLYKSIADSICLLTNASRAKFGLNCRVKVFDTAEAQIAALNSLEVDVLLTRSDVMYSNWQTEASTTNNVEATRLIMALYSETLTILGKQTSKISSNSDLSQKVIGLDKNDAVTSKMLKDLMVMNAIDGAKKVIHLEQDERASALCSGKVDALFLSQGHPDRVLSQTASMCKTSLVNLDEALVDNLIKGSSAYAAQVIPGGLYPGSPFDTRTVAYKALLVTSTNLSQDVVSKLVQIIMQNLKKLKLIYKPLQLLEAKTMILTDYWLPLHPGAALYISNK